MRRFVSAVTVAGALLAATLLTASCSDLPFAQPAAGPVPVGDRGPDQNWPEVFEFEVQPGDLNGGELVARINALNPAGGEPVPGSARHVGWVETPGGRMDFFAAQIRGLPEMPGPMWCSITTGPQGGGASCGDDPDDGAHIGLREMGGTVSETWQSWELGVSDGTALVTGVTDDGAEYTIIPRGRFAFVMWRSARGKMTLTSFDADGNQLRSIVIGEPL